MDCGPRTAGTHRDEAVVIARETRMSLPLSRMTLELTRAAFPNGSTNRRSADECDPSSSAPPSSAQPNKTAEEDDS